LRAGGRAAFSLTTATRERGQQTCYVVLAFRIRHASQKLNNIIFNSLPSKRFCRSPPQYMSRTSGIENLVVHPDLVEDRVVPSPSVDTSHFATSHQHCASTPPFVGGALRPSPQPGKQTLRALQAVARTPPRPHPTQQNNLNLHQKTPQSTKTGSQNHPRLTTKTQFHNHTNFH
jgi:hypothetical protein